MTLAPRSGVQISVFIANMGNRTPQAVALLFIGGGGHIRLREEGGQVRFSDGNFLPRSRLEFVRNNILPVIVDNPTDQQAGNGMTDAFRRSAEHAADVRAIVTEIRRRFAGLPLFLVGTSRSTLSVAWLAQALRDDITGAVLSASLFVAGRSPAQSATLSGYDWTAVRTPLLFVHHRDDGCFASPYREAARLADRFPLISVKGGKVPESGPCDPFAPHGFFGMEARTVAAIAAWMLGQPFAREIE